MVTQSVAATLAALALASNNVAALDGIQHQIDYESTVLRPPQQSIAIDCDTLDEYEQSQIELLIRQIVSSDSNTFEYRNVYYTYENLYCSQTEKTGYVIDVTYGEECAYMIVLSDEEKITPAEVVIGRHSPYYGKSGMYLYPSRGEYYIITDDGDISPAVQCTTITDNPLKVVKSKGNNVVEVIKEYNYNSGEWGERRTLSGMNCVYSTDQVKDLTNNCANVAGVIALNYWNKYFNNDILRLVSKTDITDAGNISFSSAERYIRIFYDYMNTNWAFDKWGGTLPDNCYSGFSRYIQEHGYYTKIVKPVDFEHIKLCIKCDVPVFITSVDYYFTYDYYSNILSFPEKAEENVLKFTSLHHSGLESAHTFVAYGYNELYLRKKNGELTKIELLRVADGWGGECYYHLSDDDSYIAGAVQVMKRLSGC